MAEDAGTAAAASGNTGATAQPAGFVAPTEWAESEHYKPFFKEDKSFDVEWLAKSYVETKSQLPAVPAKADEYSFEFPKDFPADETDQKLQKELAHNLKMTQAQYEGMVKHDLARLARVSEEMAKDVENAKAELVREWGGPQKFDANMARVNKAAEQFFGKEAFTEDALRNNPVVIRGLFKIAEKLTESTAISGTGAGADNRPVGIDGQPRLYFPSMDGKT